MRVIGTTQTHVAETSVEQRRVEPARRSAAGVVAWDDESREPAAASFGEMGSQWIEAIDSGRWYFDPTSRRWLLDDTPP